jgi:hypothetical protein
MEFIRQNLQIYYYILSLRPFFDISGSRIWPFFGPSGNPELCPTALWRNRFRSTHMYHFGVNVLMEPSFHISYAECGAAGCGDMPRYMAHCSTPIYSSPC